MYYENGDRSQAARSYDRELENCRLGHCPRVYHDNWSGAQYFIIQPDPDQLQIVSFR